MSTQTAPKSASKSTPKSAPPWESPRWQEAVRQNPGLKPFFDNFHSFGNSEYGLTSLRKLVLLLAFRGKLLAQDSNDEPATETLRKFIEQQGVQAKKKRETGRAATTAKVRGMSAISIGEAKMPTVEGWEWMPLTEVARLETGHTPSRKKPEYWEGDIPWIGIKDARHNHGKVISETFQTVSQLGLDNSASRLLPAKTVCLSRTASVGYVVVMGKPMATSQDFVNWVCSDAIDPEFLMYLFIAENESLLRFFKRHDTPNNLFP